MEDNKIYQVNEIYKTSNFKLSQIWGVENDERILKNILFKDENNVNEFISYYDNKIKIAYLDDYNEYHNENGPAIINYYYKNGKKTYGYYLHGEKVSKKEWLKQKTIQKLDQELNKKIVILKRGVFPSFLIGFK